VTKDINQVSIVGNLTEDPEIINNRSKNFVFLRVATGRFNSRDYQSHEYQDLSEDSQNKKDTTIHDVRIYVEHIAEMASELRKGDRVVIFGEMRNSRDGSYIILLAPNARFYKVG